MFRKSQKPEQNIKSDSDKQTKGQETPQNSNPSADEWSSEYEGQLSIDVYQTDDDIIIKSAIAGVSPEDISVTIDNDMVTIKGERKSDSIVKKENYYYQECYWGSFSRSIILPVDVESDKTSAELKNGILTVTLPKAKKAKTTKISVKAT